MVSPFLILSYGVTSFADGRVNGAAMSHDIVMGDDELLERRIDVVEIDVGDEAVDAGIDACRLLAVNIGAGGNELGQRSEIGKPARHRRIRLEAADALVVVTLGVELLGLDQPFIRQVRMLALERIA